MSLFTQVLHALRRMLPRPDPPPSYDRERRRPTQRSSRFPAGWASNHWLDGNICFIFAPERAFESNDANIWLAMTIIKAQDLPGVMREGLHWTEGNLDRGAGYIIDHPRATLGTMIPPNFNCARVYFFRDMSRLKPLWTAQMTVFFTDAESASDFDFGGLTLNNIALCEARNEEGRKVYMFSHDPSVPRINTIYENMALDGWWPWPKRPQEDEEDLLL